MAWRPYPTLEKELLAHGWRPGDPIVIRFDRLATRGVIGFYQTRPRRSNVLLYIAYALIAIALVIAIHGLKDLWK